VRLAGKIPVVPLDEERLTQIERRVVAGAVDAAIRGQRLRAPGGALRVLIAATAIAAAGVVGWAMRGAPASEPVAVSTPAPAVPAAPEVHVQTAPQRSVIDIGDARIESDPDTAFTVARPGGGVLIAVTRGKVELEVGKRGDRPPLVVRAGDTDVVVVGTRFSVDYGDGSGEVDVRVTEGVVRVVHGREETRVAAGQRWRTRVGLIALAGDPRDAGAAPGTTAEPRSPGTPAEPRRDRPAVPEAPGGLHDRHAAVPDATAASPAPARSASPARPAGREPAHPRVAVRNDPHVDLRAAIRAQPVEPALHLGVPDPAATIARYYEIAAHRSGDEASQAFYSIAWVRYFRQGQGGDALQTLDAYVRRFPGGKEYRAALWLRVRILCLSPSETGGTADGSAGEAGSAAREFNDACRAAAYTYLHEAPDAPAAHIAELLTQT
jgi:FecR-like protein